jgi:maleate isomerase
MSGTAPLASNLRIGMITPSSNTVLEPMSARIVAQLPEVSLHVARIRVQSISLDDSALGQFTLDGFLEAAALLADARVHVIGWNGTAASWMGFKRDAMLLEAITARFGVPAISAVLAINRVLQQRGLRRIALLTPYTAEVQHRIMLQYQRAGYEVVAEAHWGETTNYAFAELSEAEIWSRLEPLGGAGADAVIVMCTNMRGATLAERFEERFDALLIDSVSAFMLDAVAALKLDARRIEGWGRLFRP